MKLHLVLLLALLPGAAFAQAPVDPDWPCIQRKQPQLSLGQVWAGPAPDAAVEDLAKTAPLQKLARVLSLRRTSTEDAKALIDSFAATAQPADLVALNLATFQNIQRARDRVMAGITRYAHKQEALDAHIKQQRQAFQTLSLAESPDFDARDKAEMDIDWSTRIFQERQQSLTYVCETPVILEQRAFAMGRIILGHLPQ